WPGGWAMRQAQVRSQRHSIGAVAQPWKVLMPSASTMQTSSPAQVAVPHRTRSVPPSQAAALASIGLAVASREGGGPSREVGSGPLNRLHPEMQSTTSAI